MDAPDTAYWERASQFSPPDVYGRTDPWQTNEERLISDALAFWTVPGRALAKVRPPLPQIQLFRKRFGYRDTQVGIRDLIDIERTYGNARVDFSQRTSGYQGTSFPSLNVF